MFGIRHNVHCCFRTLSAYFRKYCVLTSGHTQAHSASREYLFLFFPGLVPGSHPLLKERPLASQFES